MPNIIQGVKVNGTVYKYDYESLENLPDPELPPHDTSYEGSDEGKVLTVATNGELKWDEAGGGGSLPDVSGASDGDVLIVYASDNSVYWGSPFPSYDTTSDVGKVLTITENGPEWVMPS